MVFIKQVNNSSPGNADTVGGNDWDKLDQYFDDNATGLLAKIDSTTTYRSGRLRIRDSDNTHSYIINGSNLAADRNITLPLLSGDDDFAMRTFAQTLTNKTFDNTSIIPYITQNINLTGIISPTQLTADQNDWNPTGLSTASTIRIDADNGLRTITGLQGGSNGRIIFLQNISANTVLLSQQDTASSAANRFVCPGEYDYPIFPGSTVQLRYDNTLTRWVIFGSVADRIPSTRYGFYFEKDMTSAASGDDLQSVSVITGGSVTVGGGTVGHPGTLTWTLGTTASDGCAYRTGQSIIRLGNSWYWYISCVIKVLQLSDGTNNYTLRVGLGDQSLSESTDAVMFRYNHAVNSGNWQLVTRSNSTETATNTTSAVGTTNFTRLSIIINPAGSKATFFIDDVNVGNNTTNIPTTSSRDTGIMVGFIKTAGTTDSNVLVLDSVECLGYSNTKRIT